MRFPNRLFWERRYSWIVSIFKTHQNESVSVMGIEDTKTMIIIMIRVNEIAKELKLNPDSEFDKRLLHLQQIGDYKL